MKFIEIEDGVWLNVDAIALVGDEENGCRVDLHDGSMFHVRMSPADFIGAINGSLLSLC